jgi:molybdopterin-guanine dinucleotide biosynthesis protein
MSSPNQQPKILWRLIIVGGHTRSIGKTQLVCDIIRAFPDTNWIAGKITQYGHGVCAHNGENCDCAPAEHACALDWEKHSETGTDSARFLQAGAKRSFWLRTKQGYLAEGLPLLRNAVDDVAANTTRHDTALIFESNSLMQFVKPSLYLAVVDPLKDDFKQSAQFALDRADALILRAPANPQATPAPLWMNLPAQVLREKPSVLQHEGDPLPKPIEVLVHRILQNPPTASL